MDNNTFGPPPDTNSVLATTTMDFSAAIRELTGGAKITRIGWHNTDYGFLSQDGWLSLYKNGETFQHWYVNDGDLKATDWITVR